MAGKSEMNLTNFIRDDKSALRVLITHSDLDGAGCAIWFQMLEDNNDWDNVVRLTLKDPSKLSTALLDFARGDDGKLTTKTYIMITDLSMTDEVYAEFLDLVDNDASRLVVIDHHTATCTNSVGKQQNVFAVSGENISATWLMYVLLTTFSKRNLITDSSFMTKFLDTVSGSIAHYDTGDYAGDTYMSTYGMKLNMLYDIHGGSGIGHESGENFADYYISYIREQFDRIVENPDVDFDIPVIPPNDEESVEKRLSNIQTLVKLLQDTAIISGSNDACVFNVPYEGFSIASYQYLHNNPDINMLMAVNTKNKTVQLRTAKDDINLAEFAKQFGGGGHPKAAGFPITAASFEINGITFKDFIK